MSKLIERLEKAGLDAPIPIGFGPVSRRGEAAPAIMLVGQVTPEELAENPYLAKAQVDAFMVSVSSWKVSIFDSIVAAVGERIWGVRANALDGKQAGRLKKSGCDFIVFNADDTAAEVLNDDDLGKLIAVGHDLTEETARAIHELPIDGVLFSPTEDLRPLTVQKLIDIQLVRGLVDKPFVMTTASTLGPPELESLRGMGVDGLVVEASSMKAIAKTKEAIANLPRRKARATSRDVLLPHPMTGLETASQESEEEGDDF